ncbi:hypothetical protein SAMN06265171_1034 [Chryseobacterium rhizoplanae]|uniref:Uncharacterized protein n=1 Tax=Chryseobacterium rhizoplanae TaxID=1609531 RepID=A0A521CHY8_9FLAO|nr:hypothetical protein [Chryseobacterium rhizoplanae]SMO58320.1 hypothetical protein SAMN06265171_1034 [Chryseobacterium rhizoplanae]
MLAPDFLIRRSVYLSVKISCIHDNNSILDYLTKVVNSESIDEFTTYQIYPTAISKTLGFQITDISSGEAKVSINTDMQYMEISREPSMEDCFVNWQMRPSEQPTLP